MNQMMLVSVGYSLLLLAFFIVSAKSIATQCDEEFSTKCFCGDIEYQGKVQYVVNCTNTNFQNASVLQNLPSKTQLWKSKLISTSHNPTLALVGRMQFNVVPRTSTGFSVLIFQGNNINELPMNVFGTFNSFLELKVVDMSNNNIRDIRGKSYHRVSNVERLILNHNQISISSKEPNHHHPRVFSNFENLMELHLTDAFADNTPEDLASDLHDIFVNSELQELRKLHLEQNEISQFKDPKVFCDLPNLQDLHLGQNLLSGLHFELNCLSHLRFLDLEYNSIKTLSEEDMRTLDKFSDSHNQSLTIDLSYNKLSGNCDRIYSWLQATKVVVRNKNVLHCREPPCPSVLKVVRPSSTSHHVGTELFLLVALCLALAMLAYTNWRPIEKQMKPLADALSRKVHYTNLSKQEDQEMNV